MCMRGYESREKDTEQNKEIMGLKDFHIGFALNCLNIRLSTILLIKSNIN